MYMLQIVHNTPTHIATSHKASRERIEALRRRMSNQANLDRPDGTPGAPHVAQQSGRYSAGNCSEAAPGSFAETVPETVPVTLVEESQDMAPPQSLAKPVEPVFESQPESQEWPPSGRYNFNESTILTGRRTPEKHPLQQAQQPEPHPLSQLAPPAGTPPASIPAPSPATVPATVIPEEELDSVSVVSTAASSVNEKNVYWKPLGSNLYSVQHMVYACIKAL